MIYYKTCECRELYYAFFDKIKAILKSIQRNVFVKEIYGDNTVSCDYDKINDLMYLKKKTDIIERIESNQKVCDDNGFDCKIELPDKCEDNTIKYFFKRMKLSL